MTEQTAWIIWSCCAAIAAATAVYCAFEHLKERRRAKRARAKRARAKLDADWERFFYHVEAVSGPAEAAKYTMSRDLLG